MVEIKMIEELLKEKYGDVTLVRLTGGYTNDTFLFHHSQSSPLVIKVANISNIDIENEIHCLNLTQDTGITPKIYDFIKTEDLQLVVMECREGINGQTILDNKEFDRTKELYRSLGESLAKSIHSKRYNYTSGIKEFTLNEINFNLDFVPEPLVVKAKRSLQNINDAKEEWVLTHGDYGIHNVLYTDSNNLSVLDWEWAEWGNPLTDIGWVCWFTKLHYPEYADSLNSIFIKEYKTYNPIHVSNLTLKAYCVYKVLKVLDKVQKSPKVVKEEWVRRLKWTMDTDILNSPA